MRMKICKPILLTLFVFAGTWVMAQNDPIDDCTAFRLQLVRGFMKGKSADSIVLASTTNEKYLKFYKELEGESKLFSDFNTLMGIDSLRVAYKNLMRDEYLGKPFVEIKAKNLNGEKILAPQAGTITVLNTWFTRCKPCLEEMPALNELLGRYEKDPNVKFISIARSSKEDVALLLNKHKFAYEIIADEKWKILSELCLRDYPANIIVDSAGIIRYFHVGIADIDEMEGVINQLKQ